MEDTADQVVADDVTLGGDRVGVCARGTRHIDSDEAALAEEETMQGVSITVGADNVPLGVNTEGSGGRGARHIDGGEAALAEEGSVRVSPSL